MAKPTERDESRQKKKKGIKAIRDRAIVSHAMAGKNTSQIAKETGVTRQTVSEVLNSDEVKSHIAEIDAKLAKGIDDAIQTILAQVKVDYVAARDLLRNYGAMRQRLELSHSGKVTLADLVAGSQADEPEGEKE